MAKRTSQCPALRIATAAVLGALYLGCGPEPPLRLTLRFHAAVGGEPLVLDEVRYDNPGGEGTFKVRDFMFFVSNIRLVADSGEFVEPESYHLVRFDSEDGTHTIVIEDVPRQDYRRLELGVGVDPAANGTMESEGELDPNSRMAWSWDVGYKFVLVEGGLVLGETRIPLVYHVGFDENYKPLSLELDEFRVEGSEVGIELHVDLLRMFDGVQVVDMATLSTVKFDHADAKLLADNYAGMLSICESECGR